MYLLMAYKGLKLIWQLLRFLPCWREVPLLSSTHEPYPRHHDTHAVDHRHHWAGRWGRWHGSAGLGTGCLWFALYFAQLNPELKQALCAVDGLAVMFWTHSNSWDTPASSVTAWTWMKKMIGHTSTYIYIVQLFYQKQCTIQSFAIYKILKG